MTKERIFVGSLIAGRCVVIVVSKVYETEGSNRKKGLYNYFGAIHDPGRFDHGGFDFLLRDRFRHLVLASFSE
jgi:hypothetical protein